MTMGILFASLLFSLPLILPQKTKLNAEITFSSPQMQSFLKDYWQGYQLDVETFYTTSEQDAILKKFSFHNKVSRMYRIYGAQSQGKRIAYGIFDSNIIRTKGQTLFFVFSPDGILQDIQMIAFYEPHEYMPPESWLQSFAKHDLAKKEQDLIQVDTLSGATLTFNSVRLALKKISYLYQFFF